MSIPARCCLYVCCVAEERVERSGRVACLSEREECHRSFVYFPIFFVGDGVQQRHGEMEKWGNGRCAIIVWRSERKAPPTVDVESHLRQKPNVTDK